MTKTIIYTVSCEKSYAIPSPSNDIVHVYVPMHRAFLNLDDALAFVEGEADSRNLVTSGGFRLSERKHHEGWTTAYGDDEMLTMTATLFSETCESASGLLCVFYRIYTAELK